MGASTSRAADGAVHYATFVPGGVYKVGDITCPVCRKMLAEGQAL